MYKSLLFSLLILFLVFTPEVSNAQSRQKKQGMSAMDHKDWLQKQTEFKGYKLTRDEQKIWGVRYKLFGLSSKKRSYTPKNKA